MLEDIKSLTRNDRTRLVPMKPELMSLEDINAKIDEIERVTEDVTIMTMGSALEVVGMTRTRWDSLQSVCKRRELEAELDRIDGLPGSRE